MRFDAQPFQRGVQARADSLDFIPGNENIRPLRDRILVEALEVVHSRWLIVPQGKPIRGRVLATGPGRFRLAYNAPKRYDTHPQDPNRRKRTKVWETKTFIPTEVKVGDIVELGVGTEGRWQAFYWGDKYCVIPQEADVCGIVDG